MYPLLWSKWTDAFHWMPHNSSKRIFYIDHTVFVVYLSRESKWTCASSNFTSHHSTHRHRRAGRTHFQCRQFLQDSKVPFYGIIITLVNGMARRQMLHCEIVRVSVCLCWPWADVTLRRHTDPHTIITFEAILLALLLLCNKNTA